MNEKRGVYLKDLIEYNKTGKFFKRKTPHRELKNKSTQFLKIIEKTIKRKFIPDEWIDYHPINEYDLYEIYKDVGTHCICSQSINNLYFIKHIETGKAFQVGSECVKKISIQLFNKLTKKKCKVCDEILMDGRATLAKRGLCSYACESKICDGCSKIKSKPSYKYCYECFSKFKNKCLRCEKTISDKYSVCFKCRFHKNKFI